MNVITKLEQNGIMIYIKNSDIISIMLTTFVMIKCDITLMDVMFILIYL